VKTSVVALLKLQILQEKWQQNAAAVLLNPQVKS